MKTRLPEKFIREILKAGDINAAEFLQFQRRFAKQNGCSFQHKDELLKAYQKLLQNGTIQRRSDLESVLQVKNVRSQSGIAVVSVLTKPFPCPGRCIFCPTEENVPKSYLSNEPAVMRAIMNDFHPYKQVKSRLTALRDTGHITEKISIRIIGGSWSAYPVKYRSWFVRQLFKACNEFGSKAEILLNSLQNLQRVNETAKSRIVELSIETRQEMIDVEEILLMRKYGITKVEMGVQSLDERILVKNRRGNSNADTLAATKLLKDFGFKVSYQMMLNLYGSTEERDVQTFDDLFSNPDYRPDHLKIYPLALVKNSELFQLYKEKQFKPYGRVELIDTIGKIKSKIPEYCRVERVIRDIPAGEIVEGGAKVSNLRQEIEKFMKKRREECRCIRCREIKGLAPLGEPEISVLEYPASSGIEYFISINDDRDKLIGFCRLRMPSPSAEHFKDSSLLREIHVYGHSVQIGKKGAGSSVQHRGYGKQLVRKAEEITLAHGLSKIAVISGVGVREYFRKLGYELAGTYMVKKL